ncbi:hypothetical protein DFJ73DRAFT_842208 [Zopfochytrium polystomum]|nr:hypothetical protein DFJ73DRAFT_842208 [Zopfochytrium polystomum]
MGMTIGQAAVVLGQVCLHLPARDRFHLSTLLRRPALQALALYAIPSASLERATDRGLVELLEFRLRHAVRQIGSVDPIASLLWTLHGHEVRCGDGKFLLLEWWELDVSVDRAVTLAARNGNLAILDWWKSSVFAGLLDISCAVLSATKFGRVDVLEWCQRNSDRPMDTMCSGLEEAGRAGHRDVLEWWLENGSPQAAKVQLTFADQEAHLQDLIHRIEFRLPLDLIEALQSAGRDGHILVLQWIKDSFVLPNWKSADLLNLATRYGQAHVLAWCKDNLRAYVPLECSRLSLRGACEQGHVAVLGFWRDHKPELWRKDYLLDAAAAGKVSVFQWWIEWCHPDDLVINAGIVNQVCAKGHVAMLQWFTERNLPLEYGSSAFSRACHNGHICILDWFKNSGLPLKFNGGASERGIIHRCLGKRPLLQWWKDSGLEVQWPEVNLLKISSLDEELVVDALQWWTEFGALMRYPGHGSEKHNHLTDEVKNFRPPVLEWWLQSGLSFDCELKGCEWNRRELTRGDRSRRRWWEERKNRRAAPKSAR